jgi:hypothetical protein
MKLIILHLDSANKSSPMSKGVVEIRINSQPYKGINMTTWHTWPWRQHEWQQFTTRPISRVRSYLNLVSSFMCMPRRTHRGWPKHYPIVHPWSEVRYRPTHRHTKLLSLGIPYIPYVLVHSSAFSFRPTDVGLNRHRRGLPPSWSKFWIRPLPFLPI